MLPHPQNGDTARAVSSNAPRATPSRSSRLWKSWVRGHAGPTLHRSFFVPAQRKRPTGAGLGLGLSPGQVDPVIERDNPEGTVSRSRSREGAPVAYLTVHIDNAAPWGPLPDDHAPLEPKAAGRPLLDGPLLRERSSHVE